MPKLTPQWATNERSTASRPTEQASRVLALQALLVAGELDLSNKSEIARKLGIHRHTLDRDLRTIEMSQVLTEEYRQRLQ